MKASDSVNSLTELTKEGDTCFICLEEASLGFPLVDSKILRNCGCKFHVHTSCWNEWIKNKSDYDCPICHKASMLKINIPPNPVLVFQVHEESPNQRRKYILYASIISFFLIASGVMIDRILND